ncbi:MAG: hypothetical protein OXC48_10915 [Endozoicomonadaceae bacterium]|nr:hypothetical protein [Endozoicomonadaceae bacterium]
MNKIVLAFYYFVCLFTGNCDCTYTKIRDNKVYFTKDMISVKFQITAESLTHEQPFDNTIYTILSSRLKIKIGKKGSKTMVKYIKKINSDHQTFNL